MYDQILTISKDRIVKKLGALTPKQMVEADAAMMCSLGISRLYLPNISKFDIKSVVTEITKEAEITFYVFELTYHNGVRPKTDEIKLLLESAIDFDHTINKHMNIHDVKTIFNCCEGLSYLVSNGEFL